MKMKMTSDEIDKWLKDHWIPDYTIRDDGKINVHSDVQLPNNLYDGDAAGFVVPAAIQFGSIDGDFRCGQARLEDKGWLPEHIHGSFDCSLSPTLSLSGIHKVVKTIESHVYCRRNSTHILGVLMIPRVRVYIGDTGGPVDTIMNKYINTGDVISAQDELIDAGFINQAKL